MAAKNKGEKKEAILRALAQMLENNPGGKITTAALAAEIGVSEAALYRHFPSKARMFEGLIDFMEDTLFSRITRIISEGSTALVQCEKIILLVLTFAEKNPGISRVLNGDALVGESERLRDRASQVFNRLDTQLKQVFREAEIKEGVRPRMTPAVTSNLLLTFIEGKISQYVRTDFYQKPTDQWSEQWLYLNQDLFHRP
ncbi:MAG: nucleoid occlusion factor SlmA [Gammaproteobacteria bacterium]|jgi:TetR/AcrR family transcriptional regulator|nr:nucleoid occlusion factor SlmA [Gammaproteobacteria bacterium]MBT6043560.1 nucleoid occlusion factor SlmA [Gammaproteobacteria bacterium]